jgi:hypothetical protein
MIVIVSDIQIKNKEPFRSAINKFFVYLRDTWNTSNTTFIFLGDLFETSATHHDIVDEILEHLLNLNQVILITGNHDAKNRQRGNILKPFRHHKNVKVIFDPTVLKIDNYKFLFIPFLYKDQKERVEKLTGQFDYICTHVEHLQIAFDKVNSIDFNKELKGTFFHGHIHVLKDRDYFDINGNQHHVVGVPIPVKHLEDQQQHRIVLIDENKYRFENVPFYFKYETINYGDEPSSKDNILNIKNVPSIADVFSKYKDYHIREDGIELKVDENSEQTLSFDLSDTKQDFITFCKEENIDDKLRDFTLGFLQ